MQLSRLSSSKMEISEPNFLDILTIQNDQISHVKHLVAPLYALFTLFGCVFFWGGVPRGLGYNLVMPFSRLSGSKIEISETDFFDTLTIQNDQISHVKHVLAPLCAFFTLIGCWGWGGSQGVSGTTWLCSFPASAAQEWSSLFPLRGALSKAIEFSGCKERNHHRERSPIPICPSQKLGWGSGSSFLCCPVVFNASSSRGYIVRYGTSMCAYCQTVCTQRWSATMCAIAAFLWVGC